VRNAENFCRGGRTFTAKNKYDGILETLRAEYEEGLAEGINLPSYDDLTRRILAKQA
jgi:hypothetical protein